MKPASTCILTINGGSSSIKFARFDTGDIILILAGVVRKLPAVAWF